MKKTLLVAAMMASFTGAAVAQNSVTLYGRLAPAMVYTSVKASDTVATNLKIGKGTNNDFSITDGFAPGGSHYGLKGVEDLGGGLKASFKFEQGLSTNAGTLTTRISTLTVSGTAWGSIGFGKDFTAGSQILSGISPLGTSYGVGSAEVAFGTFSTNVTNQVKYLSPTISGFSFGASYSFDMGSVLAINETTGQPKSVTSQAFGTSGKNRFAQLGLRYANGPVVVGALYSTIMPNGTQSTTNNKKPKNWVIGGTYDLKVVKLHAAYGQNIDGIISGGAGVVGGAKATTVKSGDTTQNVTNNYGAVGLSSGVASGRTNQWMVGLSAPVGAAGKVLVSVSQMDPSGNMDIATTDTMTNAGIVYTYSLSKRTSLYGSYSYAANYGMVKDLDVSQIGAGIVHLF